MEYEGVWLVWPESLHHPNQERKTSLLLISLMLKGKETQQDSLVNNDPASTEVNLQGGQGGLFIIYPQGYL